MTWRLPEIVIFGYVGEQPSTLSNALPVLLGTVVGGMLTISMTLMFRWLDRRRAYVENDYGLYLNLNHAINDVYGIGSRYIEALELHRWPLHPWTVMKPAIGETTKHLEVPVSQLMTLRGQYASGLTHKIVELANFRNIIVEANAKYIELHSILTSTAAPLANIAGPRLQAALDHNDPNHRPIILYAEQTADMAKQLLRLILDFYTKTVEIAHEYNRYRDHHQIQKLRAIKLDISQLEASLRFDERLPA